MKKSCKIRPFPLLLLLLILLLAVGFLFYTYRVEMINRNYHRDPQFSDWNFNRIRTVKQNMAEAGFDLTLPGLEGEVTVTAPFRLAYWSHNMEYTVEKDTEITCDFVTYSRSSWSGALRAVVLVLDGREQEAYIRARDLAKLYRAALVQNGLAEQFEADFGNSLTNRSAREALRGVDQQLYQRGAYNPGDWPFDKGFWEAVLNISILCAPLVLIVLSILAVFLAQSLRYRAFLAAYNREHIEHWDEIAGTLPEFHSLRSSGTSMDPKPYVKKPSLLDALKGLFKSI